MRGAARARRPKIKIAPPDPARLEWVSPPRWSRDNPRGTTIIFLDVDGVLNRTTKKNVQLEGALLDRLARVALVAESHIVLSSVWRLHGDLRARLLRSLSERRLVCCESIIACAIPTRNAHASHSMRNSES